ncbi:hypothetical protein EMIT0P100_10237 [Pseudomonas sp. IT-P100]
MNGNPALQKGARQGATYRDSKNFRLKTSGAEACRNSQQVLLGSTNFHGAYYVKQFHILIHK